MRKFGVALTLSFGSLAFLGCYKPASGTADSSTASSTASSTSSSAFDEKAASAQIVAADSGFVRAMISKNVDSLMYYYGPDIVSLGKKPLKGTAEVRKSYEQAVKNPPRSIDFQSGGVNFSNDHSMAWDYGTVTVTGDVNGKPVKSSGTYLNVWKYVGGRWMNVAEISSTSP